MQIKIVDSWLREYLDTKASSENIAKELSLTSVSVDKTDKIGSETVYDIEVTTNRPDLMSVAGIANEASAALSEQGTSALFTPPKISGIPVADISFPLQIENNPKLVNRIMAVVLEVQTGPSPKKISERLELSGIRSLNNVIDVTNYVMREIGHPAHVFDFDLLTSKKMIIRASKPGETLTTLDGKKYRLLGEDVVADNGEGEIIDLLGVMGTANSVVQENTKRILFFLDNIKPERIRSTSMTLGIRTEAAIINEKGVDPFLMDLAFKRGVELFREIANGKVVSKVFDTFPNKPMQGSVKVPFKKIDGVIGVSIPPSKSEEILKKLGFGVSRTGEGLNVTVPTIRPDIRIPEDVIEEIARIYGYHKLPSTIPLFQNRRMTPYADNFYWEERVKIAFKYWGFTEVYTYSLISEDEFDGPLEKAVKLKNPLSEDLAYLRNSLVPRLLKVIEENRGRGQVKIFELANTYHKKERELPEELSMLSGVIKKEDASFFEAKGLIEQLLNDLGIKNYKFSQKETPGADVYIGSSYLGYIEILNPSLIDFELNFEVILKHTTLKKIYKPLAKFPPIVEDFTFVIDGGTNTQDLLDEIKLQSFLIKEVALIDQFENSKTFHVIYQAPDRNLTNTEIAEIRNQIISAVTKKFGAKVK